MPFRVVLADSLYMISSLPSSVNTFFQFFDIFLMFSPEQSVRLTHTLARERIAQLYIPLRELRFLARSAFLCNREFQRNFLLHKKTVHTRNEYRLLLLYFTIILFYCNCSELTSKMLRISRCGVSTK